jgi:hypothetical protein
VFISGKLAVFDQKSSLGEIKWNINLLLQQDNFGLRFLSCCLDENKISRFCFSSSLNDAYCELSEQFAQQLVVCCCCLV